MSAQATQPGKGGVAGGRPSVIPTNFPQQDGFSPIDANGNPTGRANPKKQHDGTWRPDVPFSHAAGAKITLRRVRGVTAENVLKVPLRLQVPVVGDLPRDRQAPGSTWDTISEGQRSRPMGPQLLELSISTMLLDPVAQETSSPDVVAWPYMPDPQGILAELHWIAGLAQGSRQTAFRLTISQHAVWGSDYIVNELATLERVSATQKDSVGVEYVDLTFRQFKELTADRMKRPSAADKTRHHGLRAGDTLYGLAQHYYHRASLWQRIADGNGIERVRPHSAADLEGWAKHHHKTELRIPPQPTSQAVSDVAAGPDPFNA